MEERVKALNQIFFAFVKKVMKVRCNYEYY